ncbi:MAG: hypothetical protein KAX11_05165, partial [Candidatus Aminicenantes bacterium]|nr:hypothetical protein [Candidatus Aminicenantes bacterium]
PSGEPILPQWLRRVLFAVYKYSFTNHSSQLRQSQPVNNPGRFSYHGKRNACFLIDFFDKSGRMSTMDNLPPTRGDKL